MASPLIVDNVYEILVAGQYLGQECDTVLDYLATDEEGAGRDITEGLTAFREEWRTEVLPLLHEDYRVLAYAIRSIEGVLGDSPANARPLFGSMSLLGGTDDDHGTLEGTPQASGITATVRKITDGAVTTAYFPALAAAGTERRFRGRIGLGAQVEESTIETDGNILEEGYQALVTDAAVDIRGITVGTAPDRVQLTMVVLSLIRAGQIRRNVGNTLNVGAYQLVTDLRANSYVGSQNSRKLHGII